ncbi:stalk domain-containing protein [Peptoniphilus catoniae]|uniref:stalk domain-containing protein n=1 Tax=Peptoniphilus catoniae TaxID=1660341 RepID=UPI0010FDBE00|nr:stalk domain-containing protein [Peptoniphilus catoniae]
MFNRIKKLLIITIIALALFPLSTYADTINVQEPISPGVVREEHIVNYDNNNTYVNLLKIDLNNPSVKVEVVAGEGKYTQRSTVSSMAKRTDATALVNGDFFNTLLQGSPEGPSIVEGKLQTSPVYYNGLYSLGITTDNTASIEEITFSGNVKASNGASFKLDSLNKSYYWYEPDGQYSHQDRLNLYNDFWASKSRGDKKNSEILVSQDGIVEQISEGKNFNFPVPDGKFILQADGKAYDFIKANVPIGSQLSISYSISPKKDFKFLIGGHALLVDNGASVKYTKDINVLGGVRARTAAGISEDGKTLFIASAEGRTKRSAGLSLPNLSDFMVSIGAYKALNLDGGGSTAMVVKELGDFDRTRVINPEKNQAERKVVSGIGIYNTAPDSNVLQGVKISGPDSLILGQSAEYKLKSAWNESLKPMNIDNIAYSISVDGNLGTLSDNLFLALQEGEINVNLVTDSGIFASKKVTIGGFDKIKELKIKLDDLRVSEGSVIFPTTSAILKDKSEVIISPKVLNYEIDNFNYSIDENSNISINSLNNASTAKLKVSLGAISKTIDLYDLSAQVLKMNIGKKSYFINGEKKEMDTAPFIKDDRTLVPVRFIVEGLKGDVSYDEKNKVVEIIYQDKQIRIPIGSDTIYVNNEEIKMDTKAIIKDDRTFIPIRFVAESIGIQVGYEETNQEISLIKANNNSSEVNTDLNATEAPQEIPLNESSVNNSK